MKKSHEPFWSLTASGPHSLPLNGNEQLRRSDKRLPEENKFEHEMKCSQFTRTEPWFTAHTHPAVVPVIDLLHVLMLEDVDRSVDMDWSMDVVGGGGDEGRVGSSSLHLTREGKPVWNERSNKRSPNTRGKKWQLFKGAEGFCSFLCTDSSDIHKWISAGLSTYGARQSVALL